MIVPNDVWTQIVVEFMKTCDLLVKIASDLNMTGDVNPHVLRRMYGHLSNARDMMKTVTEENMECASSTSQLI